MCDVTCLFRCESPWGVRGGPNLSIWGPGIFPGMILAGGGGCLLMGPCGQSWLVSVQLHGGHLTMCGWGGSWGLGHTCWLGRAHGMQRGTGGRPLRFGGLKQTTKITLNIYQLYQHLESFGMIFIGTCEHWNGWNSMTSELIRSAFKTC